MALVTVGAFRVAFGATDQAPYRNWPSYGGQGENHYSGLHQINDRNIERLGLAWFYDIATRPSSLSVPVAVNGVVYFVAGHAVVHALDARSGKLLWKHDPEVWKHAGETMRAAWGPRGIAYDNGRVFLGTTDGRLIALDAKDGALVWSTTTVAPGEGRYITGAPWVFDGKVAIGHGGADYAHVRGYVSAYDQATGRQLWRFYTVPGDPSKGFENAAMEMAAKTWTGKWWRFGGGGTVWNAMAYDARYHRLYLGTGNGTPWNQKIRSPDGGDNLFLCSIVALDADTGEYVWHYQINPGESWDYNAAMDIELADLSIGGQVRPVILHAPKNGFFYVIDRETGNLVSAAPITPVTWASHIDLATGRPVENPEARYPGGKAVIVTPDFNGAHSIEPMSFNPGTGLAYVPLSDSSAVYVDPPDADIRIAAGPDPGTVYGTIQSGTGLPPVDLKPRPPSSALVAWNPVTQAGSWRIDMPGLRSFGGTATTAGNLLLAGNATGEFAIYAADSGRKLWSFDAQTAVSAAPITYEVDGRQYISVIAGSRYIDMPALDRTWDYRTQRWRLLTFALDGFAKLPAPDAGVMPILDDPKFVIDPGIAAAGAGLYETFCQSCHGTRAIAAGAAPSLLTSAVPLDPVAFRSVVVDGSLQANGMARFEQLTAEQLHSLRTYIRARAREELDVRTLRPDQR